MPVKGKEPGSTEPWDGIPGISDPHQVTKPHLLPLILYSPVDFLASDTTRGGRPGWGI